MPTTPPTHYYFQFFSLSSFSLPPLSNREAQCPPHLTISFFGEFPISEVYFALIFWQEKYEFLATTVGKLFNENSPNQFHIPLCVQIFNQLYCLLFKLSFKYIFINTLKKYLLCTLTYMRTELPMMAV